MKLLVRGIRFYQAAISPLIPPACRFVPSCSAYAEEALERHGWLRGCWLTLRRLCRCHPLGGKGFDPVPRRAQDGRRDAPSAPHESFGGVPVPGNRR